MKPVLVTGASGFLGWHIARLLVERGRRVRTLVRCGSQVRELPVETCTGDLRDPESLNRAAAGCEAIYHAAADYRLWSRHPREMYRSNVDGTRNMLDAARAAGVERVVHTSTVGCIGFVENGCGDEQTPVGLSDMTGHYKRSKFLAEQEALRFAKGGLPVVIVNPTAPVGDHDFKPTPTGKTILDFLKGGMPAYLDTGLNLVDVYDAAKGHLLACEHGKPGERYILGCRNMTLKEILDALAAVSGLPAPTRRIPYVLAWIAAVCSTGWASLSGDEPRIPLEGVRMARKKMFASHAKAQRELGFHPAPVESALARAVAWFRGNGYC